jgi:type I restriction enzyme S subunit
MMEREVMASDVSSGLTPKLRFPQFSNEPGWTETTLKTIADPVSERAENEDENNILTLSGEHGLVLQSEYFGKQVAGTNADRYLKIQRDDFVYNDRTTKASAYGTIKRLTKHPHGIVSPIYKCFRFKDGELPGFWEWYFESGAHDAQLRNLANEGARAGRFNVSIDRFLSTSVCAPASDSDERQKITECLSTLDELIGAESQKLDALKAHKKGLMQQLFPREGETIPRLRFPEFQNSPEWEEKPLEAVASYENGKAYEPHIVEGGIYVVVNSRFISTDGAVRKYSNETLCIAKRGDVLMVLSDLPKGRALAKCFYADVDNFYAVNQRVCRLEAHDIDSKFLCLLLNRHPKLLAYDDGMNQTHLKKDAVLQCPLIVPPEVEEQQRIVTCLSSLDDLIAAQGDKLEALKTHKKGLMQQLFPSPAEP